MVTLVYHVEDSRYVGIWPSATEGIAFTAKALGVDQIIIVDNTFDGFFDLPTQLPHKRVKNLVDIDDWPSNVVMVETSNVDLKVPHISLEDFKHPDDVMYIIGPHNGLQHLSEATVHVSLPYKNIDVRDVISLVLVSRKD